MDIRKWHRPLLLVAALMIGSLVLSTGGLLLDDRMLNGEPVWLKPFKFSVSVGIYAFTLAWLISLLRSRRRASRLGTVSAVVLTVEMVIIIGQAFRGRVSHFNNMTSFDATLYRLMGASIVVLWVVSLVVAVLVLRQRFAEPSVLWAIRIGIGLAVVGMTVAFLMTIPTPDQLAALKAGTRPSMIGAHSVGTPDGAAAMPITHWNLAGGDLRVPHFFGLHALQAMPLFALALRRFTSLGQAVRTRLVGVVGAGYVAWELLVTWQALRGQSLVAPDTLTLTTLGVIIAAVATGIALALHTGPQTRNAEHTKIGAPGILPAQSGSGGI
ncbi:MAG: hypothetical protein ACRDSK_21415 [Actinophytocola sp.]|uniref:hypothetical protein n=1 Tax=Actinophytocola sp. TaxID=1872138 RepID=UPI003D6B42B9